MCNANIVNISLHALFLSETCYYAIRVNTFAASSLNSSPLKILLVCIGFLIIVCLSYSSLLHFLMESQASTYISASVCKSIIDDPLSLCLLHHLDSPGLTLVSQSLTEITMPPGPELWFCQEQIRIYRWIYWKPDGTNSILFSSWNRNNNIVIFWILNSVSKEISVSIIYSELAYDIWIDLQDRFKQSNAPCIFQLCRDLINLN